MAQVDEYTVPSTSPLTMTALKAALDAMFAAAVTCNRGVDGAAEPQVGMLQWFTSAETETLKVYASDGWKSILFFNTSTGAITFYGNTNGTALYSAFIRTLLDDASASEALTTLGIETATLTLTNKRITKRVRSITSAAQPTINTDDCDYVDITALATNITSMSANLSGTPTIGQTLWISIVGTAQRTIAWGNKFEGELLPGKVGNGKRLDVGFIWNAVTSKWRCVAVNHE